MNCVDLIERMIHSELLAVILLASLGVFQVLHILCFSPRPGRSSSSCELDNCLLPFYCSISTTTVDRKWMLRESSTMMQDMAAPRDADEI